MNRFGEYRLTLFALLLMDARGVVTFHGLLDDARVRVELSRAHHFEQVELRKERVVMLDC